MVRIYKRYDKYFNPERTEWIKEIPVGWIQKRISFELDLITGYAFQSERFTYDDGIKLVRGDNVTEGHLRWGDKLRMWPELTEHLKQFLLSEGDVLIGMDGSKVGKNYAMVKEEDLPLLLVQRVARLRSRKHLDPKFLYYCIGNELFLFWVTINKTDPMIPHITPKDITNFEIPFPSIAEQRSIANFLDKKTKQIDNLIEQKEKLLQLLTEKRTAIITQAVTKGLNPKVKMKDSGIEWLGGVPEHWIVKRLKFLANRIIDGAHVTPTYVPEGVPFLRVTDIVNADGGELNLDDAKFIPENEHEELTRRCKPQRNDVLLSKNGTIGVTRVVDWDFEFSLFVSLCLIKLDSNLIDPYFLSYSFKSKLIENQISIGAKSNTVTNLHLDKIKEFVIPTPPKEEQIRIVEYLKKILDDFRRTEGSLIDSVNKLKEYRSSLITSAVTGQIDVRKEIVA
jgi:type I restriction enzyme S subunit